MQWINQIAAQNKFVDGKGLLFDQARVVHGGGNVTEGAFGNTAETIGGFVIVLAESIEEATGFAKDCPVLQGEGNSVEVRRLAQ